MRIRIAVLSSCIAVCLLLGCESRQAKVNKLQGEYDRLSSQFQKDCASEYLRVPPTLSPKCDQEKKQQAEAWKRLQDERGKS